MISIKLTKKQKELFERMGSIITLGSGRTFYFLPYWLEETVDHKYFLHDLDNLPKDIINIIEEKRSELPRSKLTRHQNKI